MSTKAHSVGDIVRSKSDLLRPSPFFGGPDTRSYAGEAALFRLWDALQPCAGNHSTNYWQSLSQNGAGHRSAMAGRGTSCRGSFATGQCMRDSDCRSIRRRADEFDACDLQGGLDIQECLDPALGDAFDHRRLFVCPNRDLSAIPGLFTL